MAMRRRPAQGQGGIELAPWICTTGGNYCLSTTRDSFCVLAYHPPNGASWRRHVENTTLKTGNPASHLSLSLRFTQRDTVQRVPAPMLRAATHGRMQCEPAHAMRTDHRGTAPMLRAVTHGRMICEPAHDMRAIQEQAAGYPHGRPTSGLFSGPAYSTPSGN